MAGRRIVYVGLPVAAIGGYYLYAAGGEPKVAQKKAEHDAESAKASLKGQNISGAEAKKQGEEWAQIAGSKIDHTVDDVRNKVHDADKTISAKVSEAEAKFEKLKNNTASQFDKSKNDTKKEFNQSIDNFDKTVERKTAEAKSGISSWFGFGK
ncbi:hypothetical protein HO173_011362 [Letharia columbiana]|uniref:Calcofluor white hypersensitive protein n=1 Tax=Letharia columbiana TaxID=112416 RepID=A0A8H6FJM1_9LECA|nr:uncharacterized protein HO173_011362 [Letharia columbiana]KAF6229715.1 hypothetical protein HO173_011362 [Letharia columbiana]